MRLGALIEGLDAELLRGRADVEVRRLRLDSRDVAAGDAFFALPGRHTDGSRFVSAALARGARVVVTDGDVVAPDATVVRSPSPRRLLGQMAARLAGDPSAGLCLVGVTGTNGKTTTTYLLDAVWRAAGHQTGVIGTISYRFGAVERPAPYTTPEAPHLQEMLAEMRAAGTTHVVMEVSSHALAQDRVAGCRFDAAVFTNLTRDHLDFHGDEERYFAAKARLFLEELPACGKPHPVAVVNGDDPRGAWLAGAVRTRKVTYGRGATDVRATGVESTLAGTRGTLVLGSTARPFTSALVGAAHTENVLAAAATAWALGVDPDTIVAGLAAATPPPGRVERIAGPGFTVVVDYAHTPDALARLLDGLRPLTPGKMITVFGCGGDRDRGKRPLMGEAAARSSDVVLVTSDNPRTEDPHAILADIEVGLARSDLPRLRQVARDTRGWAVEADRPAAIRLAVDLAQAGDLVVVAGKGHEDYQIIGTEKRHLDDREEVRRALVQRG